MPNSTASDAWLRDTRDGLDAVAFEIATWRNLDDYFGLTNHLRGLGYGVLEIGATRLDALIDEERAARETRH